MIPLSALLSPHESPVYSTQAVVVVDLVVEVVVVVVILVVVVHTHTWHTPATPFSGRETVMPRMLVSHTEMS